MTLTADLQSMAHIEEEGVEEIREHIMEGVHVAREAGRTRSVKSKRALPEPGSLARTILIGSAVCAGVYAAVRVLRSHFLLENAALVAIGYFLAHRNDKGQPKAVRTEGAAAQRLPADS